MRRLIVVLFLLLSAACKSPTAPDQLDPVDGHWFLSADASREDFYCVANMKVQLNGDLTSFAGIGDLSVTTPSGFSYHQDSKMSGNSQRIMLNQFDLLITSTSPNLLTGVWTCEGAAGVWRLESRP